jgi:hypothetical protein
VAAVGGELAGSVGAGVAGAVLGLEALAGIEAPDVAAVDGDERVVGGPVPAASG